MRRREEMPTERKDDPSLGGTVVTHPAFGTIGASHVQGSVNLFGSDFTHNGYVTVTIRQADVRRDLSRDWVHGSREYISVALSESQWAAFVSRPNSGSGVPCTVEHVQGEQMPRIAQPPRRKEMFQNEVLETLQGAMDTLEKMRESVEAMPSLSAKARKDILSQVSMAQMQLSKNVPFVAHQFNEHVETVTDHAKIEIEAHMQQTLIRAGLAAIAGANELPIVVTPKSVTDGQEETSDDR